MFLQNRSLRRPFHEWAFDAIDCRVGSVEAELTLRQALIQA